MAAAPTTSDDFLTSISQEAYFAACPDAPLRLPPSEEGVDQLLQQLPVLSRTSLFPVSTWSPSVLARLAFEGLFVVTWRDARGAVEPLAELQPFYGVLLWPHFEASGTVRRSLRRLRASHGLRLDNCRDPSRTWERLDAYHGGGGRNWLTRRYLDALLAASKDEALNFKLACIELYDDSSQDGEPLAGEVGFTVGRVYTSLSGWTAQRSAEGHGTAQLVLLGRWLQRRGYAFWSLGHCYDLPMAYKRHLGHRVYPRADFLRLLRLHRGSFRGSASEAEGFLPLREGESVDAASLVS
jgi:hypothetical protein